ncbi:hypothetical protein ES702_04969 [subsurface metagenome]
MKNKNLKIKGLNIVQLLMNNKKNHMILGNGDGDRNLHYDTDQYDVEIEMDHQEFFNLVVDQIKKEPLLFSFYLTNLLTGGCDGSKEKKIKKNPCSRLYAKDEKRQKNQG